MTFTVGRATMSRFESLPASVLSRINTSHGFESLNRRNRGKYTRQISTGTTQNRREGIRPEEVASTVNFQTVSTAPIVSK